MRIVFGPFILDRDTRQVTRGSREIHLTAKAFDLLAVLALDRPKVLSKEVLQERLWPATFVAEANLSNLVAEVREALGDAARAPVYIRTVHGFGYRAKRDSSGRWEIHGRLESTDIKVNGVRIDVAEIEEAIRDCPGVSDGVVFTASVAVGDPTLAAAVAATPTRSAPGSPLVSVGVRPPIHCDTPL